MMGHTWAGMWKGFRLIPGRGPRYNKLIY